MLSWVDILTGGDNILPILRGFGGKFWGRGSFRLSTGPRHNKNFVLEYPAMYYLSAVIITNYFRPDWNKITGQKPREWFK